MSYGRKRGRNGLMEKGLLHHLGRAGVLPGRQRACPVRPCLVAHRGDGIGHGPCPGNVDGVLPQIVIAPWAGAYVDRWNRRLTMIGADSLIALLTVLLMLAFLWGAAEVWMLLLVMFGRATLAGFH